MQPLTSSALRSRLCLYSTARAARCPHPLHAHARCQSTESPHFARAPSAPHVSLSNGLPLYKFTPKHTEPSPPEEMSDGEWEIRTAPFAAGRAIYVLERTLPDFFQVGLVANIDPTRPDIVDVPVAERGGVERIYSPAIRLTYTPPVALPPPFPRTLSLEGLGLYMASSVFIRHTMKTLYSDLRVEMRRLVVQTPSDRRSKRVFVGVSVYGTTRVSGGQGEWQVDSTYGFSPTSGLINEHRVETIQPAPHEAAYGALRSVFGMAEPGKAPVT